MEEVEQRENCLTEPNSIKPTSQQVTQNFKYIVLLVSFLAQFLNLGFNYVAGVLHIALLEKYHDDVISVNWLGSIYVCMFALGAPIASLVTNLYDCRTSVFLSGLFGLVGFAASCFVTDIRLLFLTYACVAGLGQAFAQVGSLVVLGYYFEDSISTASSIALCGTASAMFVLPPFTQKLIDEFGLSGAFLLIGALVSHCCVFGLIMRPPQFEKRRKILAKSGRTKCRAFMFALCGDSSVSSLVNIPSLSFMASTLCLGMGYSVHILLLPDFMKDSGASFEEASWTISSLGVGSILSRLLLGVLGQDSGVPNLLIYPGTVCIATALTLTISLFTGGTAGRLAYGFLFGLYSGGLFSMQPPICLEIMGIENLSLGFGVLMLCLGTGFLTGPPIADSVLLVGNQGSVFLSSSFMLAGATITGFMASVRVSKRSLKHEINMADATPEIRLIK